MLSDVNDDCAEKMSVQLTVSDGVKMILTYILNQAYSCYYLYTFSELIYNKTFYFINKYQVFGMR